MEITRLTNYIDAEISFFAIKYNTAKEEYNLELGDEFNNNEPEELDDEEIEEWANQNGYLDNNEDYILEDGGIDFDALRLIKQSYDEECQDDYPSNNSYPSGRAFDWFSKNKFKYPNDIEISIVDGDHPGSGWRGVAVTGYDSLVKLQLFLFKNNIKVNFEIE
jgi:hypothetical protein